MRLITRTAANSLFMRGILKRLPAVNSHERMHVLLCFPNYTRRGNVPNDSALCQRFFVSIAGIAMREESVSIVQIRRSTEAWKVSVNKTEQIKFQGPFSTNVFLTHARAKLRLVELAHHAIHPSETTFVPICFYKRAYLNG
jgi:hypothetical protein